MARHAPTAPARAVDESMTLLNEIQRRPLDPGYAEAAARRTATGAGRGPVWRVAVLIMAGGLGIGVAAASLTLRHPTADDRQARQMLEQQVQQRKDAVAVLEASNSGIAAQVAALQDAALRSEDPALLEETRRWSVAAGTAPVTGPGLRVVLSDAPMAPEQAEDLDLLVQDVDLQVLVNGLWAAGAEAVAVNGQRLTAMSAIRSAGSAVLVDLVPLVGPYTVEAIGDAGELQANLARSSAGQHVAMLHATYGIGLEMSSVGRMELPGSTVAALRQASVPEGAMLADRLTASPTATGGSDEGGKVP